MPELPDRAAESGEISPEVVAQLTAMQPRLYGYILKRTGDRDQADELLQRVCVVICEKAADFQEGTNFQAWAFTIARFQLMGWRKAHAKNWLLFDDTVYELLEVDPATESAHADSRIQALRECLKKLRPQDLFLIRQRYQDSCPISTIAANTNKTIAAVGMSLSRIRRQLGHCIQATLKQTSGNK